MKNTFKLVLASLFVVALAACNGSKPAETTEPATDSVAVVDSVSTDTVAADTVATDTTAAH